MNTLDFAIISEYQLRKIKNEYEELSDKQLELLENMTDKAYSLITENDFNSILSENETLYHDVQNRIDEVFKKYNLSFFDNRNYEFFCDAVYSMLERF